MSTLSKAIDDLEEQKRRIDSALRILRELNQNGHSTASSTRNLSVEGRQRIAEAQKRRWARVRAQKKTKK
ncbi:MAG TPA: hypothetical protein VNE83_00085 [Terriglobales bacterium]|nr:hypothetical protein [Terriglobales bacterium]